MQEAELEELKHKRKQEFIAKTVRFTTEKAKLQASLLTHACAVENVFTHVRCVRNVAREQMFVRTGSGTVSHIQLIAAASTKGQADFLRSFEHCICGFVRGICPNNVQCCATNRL